MIFHPSICLPVLLSLLLSLHATLPPLAGLNLKVLVIDVETEEVRDPVQIRAEQGWKVGELKSEIAEVCILHSTMAAVEANSIDEHSDIEVIFCMPILQGKIHPRLL